MLVKILGGVDVAGAVTLIFLSGLDLPSQILSFLGIAFIIKSGIGLLRDFGSWVDCISGIIFFLLIFFNIPWVICLIVGIFLGQKGIVSFL